MPGDRNQLLTTRLRFGIAVIVAITLHASAMTLLTEMSMPSPQGQHRIVGVLIKEPTKVPLEQPRPAPPLPVAQTPTPLPSHNKPVSPKASLPALNKPSIASSYPPAKEKPVNKVDQQQNIETQTPSTPDTLPVSQHTPTPQTASLSNPQSILSPPLFHADYLHNPHPRYPLMSRKRREEGEVRLRVQVDAMGHAQRVRILSSSGHSRLDQAAISAVQAWRFTPAKQAGMNITAWVEVPIQFNLEK
jgi:protein TonB